MKRSKKILALLLSGFILSGIFAGCDSTVAESSGSAENAQESMVQSSDESHELTAIRVMGIDNMSSNTGKEVYLSDWVNGDSRLWQKLTDDLAGRGIKLELELIKEDQYEVVCQTNLAAGLNCDFMNITPLDIKTRLSMVEQGQLVAVNDIWENHSDGSANEFFTSGNGAECVKKLSLEDGKLYWVPAITVGDYNGIRIGAPLAFHIRKDWLDKLGLGLPETTQELFTALTEFQEQDVNGSGEKDEVISVELKNFGTGIAQWFGLGASLTYTDDESGKILSPWYQDENVKGYIEYMQRLVETGLVDTSDQSSQKKAENKISGLHTWATETWEEPAMAVAEGDAAAYLLPMTATAISGTEPSVLLQRGYQISSYNFAFTGECKDLDAAGALLDYLSTEGYALLSEYGIEDYTYTEDGGGNRAKIKTGSDEVLIMANLPALWVNNSILPRRELNNRAEELVTIAEAGKDMGYPENGFQEKADFVITVYESGKGFSHDPEADLAVPTLEELEKSASIKMDLETYSEELLTKLILGQKSLDDWDSYISDLKRLGLDDLIEINQARLDRTK